MNIIETEDLSFVYGQGTPFEKKANDKLNIQIKEGEFVGIIGHTGSGKSTLVQMLNGLIKPTSGTVKLNGQNIWAAPKEIRKVRFKVGLVLYHTGGNLAARRFDKLTKLIYRFVRCIGKIITQ